MTKSKDPNRKVRSDSSVCIIGNLLGARSGYVTTQGLKLSEFLTREGHTVSKASHRINRFFRLADILVTVFRSRSDTDVIILEVYSGLSMILTDAVTLLAKNLGLPVIGVLHGGNLPDFAARFPRWTRRVFARFTRAVAPSQYLAEAMRTFRSDVIVIPNVIEIGNYTFKQRTAIEPKLLWMRSFHQIYNPQLALDVLHKLKEEYSAATLVMAGPDKGLESDVKRRAASMGLGHSVRFPGFLNESEKTRELDSADIFINTSHIDNMPVSVVEACAAGLPVVTTRVGGIDRLITDGSDGLLVKDDSADEMASAIKTILSDPELTRTLSLNARRLSEASAWENVYEKWRRLFADISAKNATEPEQEILTADGSQFSETT